MTNRKNTIHIEGNVTNSKIANEVNTYTGSHFEKQIDEEKLKILIEQIHHNYDLWVKQIESFPAPAEEKEACLQSLREIHTAIQQDPIQPESIRRSAHILEQSSWVASICSAVLTLIQLVK